MVISEERLRTTEERLRSKGESSLLQVVVPPHAAIVNTNNNNNNIEIVQESEGVPSAAVITIVKDQNQQNPLLWRGVVVLLCAVWASNFACAKIILAQPGMNPSLYAVARFAIAAISLLPGSIIAARQGKISQNTAISAIVCGIWVAFGYLGQTVGLMTTTPSRACVICSLNCIFVAIVSEYMRVNTNNIANTISINIDDRDNYDETTNNNLMKLIPALIAVIGVAIIELKGAAGNPTIGDLICFSQPVGFGMGYLQLEQLMKKEPSAALPVSGIKLAVVALAALLLFESSSGGGWMVPDFTPILSSPVALRAICYTGIVTTSLALWVESIAFQRVKATDASIILTTEPLFAAATSAVLVGERFGVSDIIGAMFIVGACIFAIKMEDNSDSSTIEGSS